MLWLFGWQCADTLLAALRPGAGRAEVSPGLPAVLSAPSSRGQTDLDEAGVPSVYAAFSVVPVPSPYAGMYVHMHWVDAIRIRS